METKELLKSPQLFVVYATTILYTSCMGPARHKSDC